MSTGFLIINAIFFGVIALIYTYKWLFAERGIKQIEVLIWLPSFVWAAYCFTKVVGI